MNCAVVLIGSFRQFGYCIANTLFDQPQLQQQLYDTAKQNGVHLRYGTTITAVDPTTTTVTLESGENVHADLILGADGVHVCRCISV